MIDGSPYWTPQRKELVKWLEDRAPSFVEGYVAAVRLLHMQSFPGRVRFICHAVRDIYRHLPRTFGIKSLPRPADVFPAMVKDLVRVWKDFPPRHGDGGDEVAGADVLISPQVHGRLKKIVERSEEIKDQSTVGKQFARALFGSLERREDAFIAPWIIDAFDAEYDFFVHRAHFLAGTERAPTDDGLLEHFEAFERAFHSLVGPYFSGKGELDAILQDTNAATD